MARLTSGLLCGLVLLCSDGVNAASLDTVGSAWLDSAPPVPRLELPASPDACRSAQDRIRDRLRSLLGDLPPRPVNPQVRTQAREDRGSHWFESFTFENGAGATVPGWLFLPKTTNKAPAILYCHWHGGEYDRGKVELVRTNHSPQEPGPTLAARGFAVLAIDAYCFGERNGLTPDGQRGGAGELSASKFNLWLGRTLWGMILRDDLIALDYLASRPEVDAARLGVTGISMGATRSWWLMALDERLKAGVAVACLTRYQDLIRAGGLKYHGIYYYVPGMLRHFDTEAVIACAAPRALLCLNGDQDAGSPVGGIHAIEEAVRPAWRVWNREDSFRSVVYPGVGHAYTPAMWDEMLGWMDRHLKPPSR